MAGSYSISALAILLVVGLVIGGAGVYVFVHSSSSTQTVTTTQISTVTVTTATSSSGNTPTLAQFQAALTNTKSVNLTINSYDFGKGTLSVVFVNSGSAPIVLSPTQVLYNGTSLSTTYFVVIDPTATAVGVYAYVPHGSQVDVQVGPPITPLQGQKATLQILNDVFNFTYGTSG
jgi:hypothetical protein